MGRRLLLLRRNALVAGAPSHAMMVRREGDRRRRERQRGRESVPLLAAGIGDDEGRDPECPRAGSRDWGW